MEDFDKIFYKLFYYDLKELNDVDLKTHYLDNSKKENRIININQFNKFLKYNLFDSDFYIKLKELDIVKNKYITLVSYQEYLKNNDFKNENELLTFLQLNKIDLIFFKRFYLVENVIDIYKLYNHKVYNHKTEKVCFTRESELDSYLTNIGFDIKFYKSFYNLDLDELEIKKNYIDIGQPNKYFINKKVYEYSLITNTEIKKSLEIKNNYDKKELELNKKEVELNKKELELNKKEFELNKKELELNKKDKTKSIKEKNLELKEKYILNELDKEKYKLKLEFDKKEFILKKKIMNLKEEEIKDFLEYEEIMTKFFFCLNNEGNNYCKEKFNLDDNSKIGKLKQLGQSYKENIYKHKKLIMVKIEELNQKLVNEVSVNEVSVNEVSVNEVSVNEPYLKIKTSFIKFIINNYIYHFEIIKNEIYSFYDENTKLTNQEKEKLFLLDYDFFKYFYGIKDFDEILSKIKCQKLILNNTMMDESINNDKFDWIFYVSNYNLDIINQLGAYKHFIDNKDYKPNLDELLKNNKKQILFISSSIKELKFDEYFIILDNLNKNDIQNNYRLKCLEKVDIILCDNNYKWFQDNKFGKCNLNYLVNEKLELNDINFEDVNKFYIEELDKDIILNKYPKIGDNFTLYNNYKKFGNLLKNESCKFNLGVLNFTPISTQPIKAIELFLILKKKNSRFKLFFNGDNPNKFDSIKNDKEQVKYYQQFYSLVKKYPNDIFIEYNKKLEDWLPNIGNILLFGNDKETIKMFKYSIGSGCIPYNSSNDQFLIDTQYFNKFHIWNIELSNNVRELSNTLSIVLDDNMEECPEFKINESLKDFTITLLGYNNIKNDGSRHTNWFPWNRFKDVYETIGYKCEWTSLEKLERKDEKRLFITWNEPTSLELYQSGKVNKEDIIFQKLTSLGKGMNDINWTENPKKWCEEWNWPIYRTVEYLYDLGLNIYAFGCKTEINLFSEKKRICEKLKDIIHWITWGGTPFNWEQIKNCKLEMNNLNEDISFVGSKWGKVGRGNIDAWDKYIEPFESDNCKHKFNQYGGIGNKMVTDDEMVEILKKSKLCPIIHAPSWQAERGIQDRFFTVFLSGRFGICDNLGAVDIFGDEIKDICIEDPEEYYKKSIYYLEHPEEQIKYIELIQKKIKEKYNFYRQWERVFNNIIITNNDNQDIITDINYMFIPNIKKNYIPYKNENINHYFDKIFIVNMKKDVKKKIYILEIFEQYGIINYEFIDAIDGNKIVDKNKDIINLPLSTNWEKINKKKHISNLGELGCLLSHLRILEISKERGYKKWLHLEDDVIFHHNFNNLFTERMKHVPNNWDILYFGTTQSYWRKYNKEIINNLIYKANLSCGTFSFAVSNTNIDFIIDKFKLLKYPADGTLTHEVQNILNCYVFKENLIVARLNNSSIRKSYKILEEIEEFKRVGWDFEKYNIDILNINKKIFLNDTIKNDFNIIFNNLTNINEFRDYVKNKKIAIIGPSPSIKNEKNGEYIEKNYDIIIRINKQWKHSEELDKYIGKRTDILYNCLDYREDCGGDIDINFNENKLKYIVSTIKYDFLNTNHRDSQFHGKSFLNWYNYFHLKNRNRIKFIPIDNNVYDYYDTLADTRINTGLMAIFHILNFDIKELYIKGFSFFLDGYLSDYRDYINGSKCVNENDSVDKVIDFMIKKNKNHDQEKQWKLFKNIYKENKEKINLDETLKKILDLEKFPNFS